MRKVEGRHKRRGDKQSRDWMPMPSDKVVGRTDSTVCEQDIEAGPIDMQVKKAMKKLNRMEFESMIEEWMHAWNGGNMMERKRER